MNSNNSSLTGRHPGVAKRSGKGQKTRPWGKGGDSSANDMQRFMMRSKIHRATLTGKVLDYEGSIALDRRLLHAADLLPGEQVHVLNVNNGERLVTYVIEAQAGSGTVMLNGPAARLGEVGDKVIIIAYGIYTKSAAARLIPRILHVDHQNAPVPARRDANRDA